MIGIGAGFDGRIYDAAQKIAELRGRILADQIEFLDGVGAGRVRDFVVVALIVVYAIEDVIVGLFAIAVDVRAADLKGVLARDERSRIGADGSRE